MTCAQAHRGPDDWGYLERSDVVLGHRRLSIIDLSAHGHQPLANEAGNVWACFNGEIYNHATLRRSLEACGHRFASLSDTEVLVHGYEAWGIDGLLGRLRGMFAFALYDGRRADDRPGAGGPRGRLFLVRDRFGIKPLYYAAGGVPASVVFASEVRALARSGLVDIELEQRAVMGFLLFGSVPSPWTTLRSVRALAPGHYLEVGDGAPRVVQYYAVDTLFAPPAGDDGSDATDVRAGRGKRRAPAAYVERLRSVLEETVELHLISDAPLGIFLSGGIDSSALVALAAARQRDLRTVGIVFEEGQVSEEVYQRAVAERYATAHHSVMLRDAEVRSELERFFAAMDQPTIDGLNTYFVARAARATGLKAVLSGTGGDEVFAGYRTLRQAATVRRLHRAPAPIRRIAGWAGAARPSFRKLRFLEQAGPLARYLALRGLFTPREAAQLLGASEQEIRELIATLGATDVPEHPMLAQQYLEMRHYLVDQLLRDADVFGMAHSLEIRVPFLDHVLAETVLRTPPAWRVDETWPKPLLSRTLQDLLPRQIVFRPKQGFQFPFALWLRRWAAAPPAPASLVDSRAHAAVWADLGRQRVHWSRPLALLVLSRWTL